MIDFAQRNRQPGVLNSRRIPISALVGRGRQSGDSLRHVWDHDSAMKSCRRENSLASLHLYGQGGLAGRRVFYKESG
jgi:hypothetical protein